MRRPSRKPSGPACWVERRRVARDGASPRRVTPIPPTAGRRARPDHGGRAVLGASGFSRSPWVDAEAALRPGHFSARVLAKKP